MKVIQINGFRGILMAGFVVTCLFAGFVLFPGDVIMHLWNRYLVPAADFPIVNLFQGVLLWGMCAVSYYIIVNGRMPLSFGMPDKLSDAELNMIMKQARINSDMKKLNNIMRQSDSFIKQQISQEKPPVITSPMNEKKQKEDNIDNIKNLK